MLEEQKLLFGEEKIEKKSQVLMHIYQAADVKVCVKVIQRLISQSHFSITLANIVVVAEYSTIR